MSDDEVVAGRVEDGGVAVATLEVAGQRHDRAQGEEVVLSTGDGVVRVRLPAAVLVDEVVDGPWGELASPRLTALFAEVAPGDHVHVRITGAAVDVGDFVAARVHRDAGSVVAVHAAVGTDEAGARAALARVEASERASRDEDERAAAAAARESRRKLTPHPPWARMTVVLALVAVGMMVLSTTLATGWDGFIPQGRDAAGTWAAGVGFGAATLLAWQARHDVPFVHRVGVERPGSTHQWVVYAQVFMVLPAMSFATGRSKMGVGEQQPEAGLVIACLVPAVVGLIGVVRAFLSVRPLRALASAPRLTVPPPPRTWGVIEGVVAGSRDSPDLSATIRRGLRRLAGSRYGWVVEDTVTTTAAPIIRVDAGGWQAEVHTTGLIWAAAPIWQSRAEDGASRALAAIRKGDEIRVLARTGDEGDVRLRAGGPESLFVVAGQPSAFLRRALNPPLVLCAYVALVVASLLT